MTHNQKLTPNSDKLYKKIAQNTELLSKKKKIGDGKLLSSTAFEVITDLSSGSLAGYLLGYCLKKFLHLNNLVVILCVIFGLAGGYYNIFKKHTYNKRNKDI